MSRFESPAACSELLSHVAEVGRGLMQAIMKTRPAFSECWTPLPLTKGVTDFFEGGFYQGEQVALRSGFAERVESDDAFVGSRIGEYLAARPTAFAIFENQYAKRNDAFLSRCRSRVLYYRDDVLHFVTRDDKEIVRDAITEAKSLPTFIGLIGIISRSTIDRLRCNNEVNDYDIYELVGGAEYLLIGAFDGESYVLCHFSQKRRVI